MWIAINLHNNKGAQLCLGSPVAFQSSYPLKNVLWGPAYVHEAIVKRSGVDH